MDIAFLLRAKRMLANRKPAEPDFTLFSASLQDWQAQSPAAQAERGCRPPESEVQSPLAEILCGGPAWRDAVAAQGGCFSPAVAQRSVNRAQG